MLIAGFCLGFCEMFVEFALVLRPVTEVTNFTHAPPFDGKAFSFANYEEKVIFRNKIPTLEPRRRLANLQSHMTCNTRRACVAAS